MRHRYRLYFLIAAFLGLASQVLAQRPAVSVVISPENAVIEPGTGLKFEAHVFDANGNSLKVDEVIWQVRPDSLAKISEDGFLQAGRQPGEVRVLAFAVVAGSRYSGEARVVIGQTTQPDIRIVVSPPQALVAPGTRQQFTAKAVSRENPNLRIDHVRWLVEPMHLGSIDRDGVFIAGRAPGQGHVIALVDIAGRLYRGSAQVTVTALSAASLRGTVTEADGGKPLAGALVTFQRLPLPDRINWMQTVRTDSSGNYGVRRLVPGLYIVKAEARGYLPQYYNGKDNLPEANVVQVQADEEIAGIDFALGRGGAIRGLVASEIDSTPIAHAHVAAVHIVTRHRQHAMTDANGQFWLGALRAGDYAVSVEAAGFAPEFYRDQNSLLDADLLTVTPPDEIGDIDIYLAMKSAIAGRVVDANDGSPLVRAQIAIYPLPLRRPFPGRAFKAVTGADGHYIAPVPPGDYVASVAARGYFGEFYDDAPGLLEADTIRVAEGLHTTGIDFALDRLGSISGTVRDQATGEPLAGAIVTAFHEFARAIDGAAADDYVGSRHLLVARTDSSGSYVIPNIEPGRYFVKAQARGYLEEFWQEAAVLEGALPVEIARGASASGIDFTLGLGGTIAGVVVDSASSAGLGGATVTLWARDRSLHRHVFTARDGSYAFDGLPAGDYLLYASLQGYQGKFYDNVDSRDETTPVTVEAGGKVTGIDFALPRFHRRLGTIAGVVVSEPDTVTGVRPAPLAGAMVLAVPLNAGPAQMDVTDAFGNYRITRLVPGEYIVMAWARGYIGEFYNGVTSMREATPVDVEGSGIVEGIDFALREALRGPYRIAGKLRHQQGTAALNARTLEGMLVIALDGQRRIVASALANAEGDFVIGELPAGGYKIMASGAGFAESYFGGTNLENARTVVVGEGRSIDDLELDATEIVTSAEPAENRLPVAFALEQNYPNPFNPETMIRFALPQQGHVKLQVYNLLGQVVSTLVDRQMEPGFHQVSWNGVVDSGRPAASGVYLLRIDAENFSATRRMLLMK